jgi:hypothetical protein
MQYRNLYRYFTINKAANHWRKDTGVSLSEGQINLLIALTTGDNFSLVELREYMKRFKRAMADDVLLRYLKLLVSVGYVESFGYWPVRYKLTMNGKNALNDLERRCRETRYDK